MSRRAVVSYDVEASDAEKRRALLEGIRDCAAELVEMGAKNPALAELEQVANDAECGELA
jgi:hypothetical protein